MYKVLGVAAFPVNGSLGTLLCRENPEVSDSLRQGGKFSFPRDLGVRPRGGCTALRVQENWD